MISRQDAKHIIKEIRSIRYYASNVRFYQKQIDEVDIKIMSVTEPHSPVISNEPKGHGESHEKRWAALIDQKDEIEKKQRPWIFLLEKAEGYYNQLLQSEDKDYVADFFSGRMKMSALERKYHYSNAYTTIIRIIRQNIKVL